MDDGKIYIIAGHYGSGKTEFAVNLAYRLKAAGREVAVADLDIVNPYFRSREKSKELSAAGIRVVSNNFENDPSADVPAISSEVQSFFINRQRDNVIDVGGDPVGARVLGRFSRLLAGREYEMWSVINANRYQTRSADEAIEFMESIESASGLKINKLINNTHLMRETSVEDIVKGDRLVREIMAKTGIGVKYVCFLAQLLEEVQKKDVLGELFPIHLQMRPHWL